MVSTRRNMVARLASAVAISAPIYMTGPGRAVAQVSNKPAPFSNLQVGRVDNAPKSVDLAGGDYSILYVPPPAGLGPDGAFIEIEGPGGKDAPVGTSECVLNKPMLENGTYLSGFDTFYGDTGSLGGWVNQSEAPDAKSAMLKLSMKLGEKPLGKYTSQDLRTIGSLAAAAWGRCKPGTPGKPTV